MEVRPFTIHVPDDVLDDLRRRLGHTRFPDEIPGSGWDYGSNLDYLKALVHYWRTDFDWRAQEAKLNRWHHYKTPVDGLNIHFIHERGIGPRPMPLVMTHGWPSCFVEMTKILPFLTDPGRHGGDPADAFDLVVPSLPGFGFSDHRDGARHGCATRGWPLEHAHDRQPGVPALCGAGRRHWRRGDLVAGLRPCRQPVWHSPHLDHAPDPLSGTGCHAPHRGRAGAHRPTGAVAAGGGRLRPYSGHQTPDPGLRAQRLPGRTGRLDCGEIPHLERLPRRRGSPIHQGRTADHRDHLLGDPDDQLLHPDVFGEPAQPVGDGQRRQGPGPGGHGPVSPGNRPSAQRVGRAVVPYSALGRDAQRRPLRRLGRTRVVGAGGPRLLSPVSLESRRRWTNPRGTITMPWAHRTCAPPGRTVPWRTQHDIRPQEGVAWTRTQSTSTSTRK